MRNLLICLVSLILLTACSSVSSFKGDSISVSRTPTVFVNVKKDPSRFSPEISRRLSGLGFKMVGSPAQADYVAKVEYSTYFDVVHQTFNYFDISLVDSTSHQTKVRSRYVGRFGFNNCNDALNLVFKDLAGKLKR